MFASSAPYVVTVLVSVITWVLSTYYENLKNTRFLSYEVTRDVGDPKKLLLTYRFTNNSPAAAISGISVALNCPTDEACFQSPFGRLAQVPPWGMPGSTSPEAGIVTQDVDLPPGMSFEIEAHPVSATTEPFVYFTRNSETSDNIKIVNGFSLELFVATSYLYIIFGIWAIVCSLLARIYYANSRKRPPENIETVHVKILRG